MQNQVADAIQAGDLSTAQDLLKKIFDKEMTKLEAQGRGFAPDPNSKKEK
jgi:hypothetical protein